MKYDAIIVGGRCAGSPTAMLLARKGYRVLLVDKATFPSDTISTHYIHQPGVARLDRWGLLSKVTDSNCPPISKVTLDLGSAVLKGSSTPEKFGADAYSPRRRVLDKILIDSAIEAGVEFREAFSVDEALMDGERVIGIRGHATSGTVVTELAPMVVGADGVRSIVARTVRARTYNARRAFSCSYYSYWSGIATEGAEVYLRPGRVIAAWPTNDDLVIVFVELPIDEFQEFHADISKNFLKILQKMPRLAARLHSARREERFYGTANMPNYFRQPFGRGWALVGDAGYHRDPITAQGITDSFRDAELLAEAIDHGYSGKLPLEVALADYESQRNKAVKNMYRLTTSHLASSQTPGGRLLLWALKGNQAEIDRFFGTIVGTTSISEFFSPSNVLRIIGARCLKGARALMHSHNSRRQTQREGIVSNPRLSRSDTGGPGNPHDE